MKAVKVQKPPIIGDPNAMETLEAAAAAVGLSVPQLAALVVDSGAVSDPSFEGLVQNYTLEDLGQRLWATMQEQPRSKRAEWFAGLVETQKAAIIVVLRDRGFSTETISRDFQIDAPSVMRMWNTYASDIGTQVVGLRLDTIAGQMQIVSERAQEMASQAGDHKAVWTIEKDRVALMQSLGIVDRAIHRVEVSHKFGDRAEAEIEALVKLREKQKIRIVESQQIAEEVARGDPIPVIDKDGDD